MPAINDVYEGLFGDASSILLQMLRLIEEGSYAEGRRFYLS
ncbi:hypothetical protein [Nostoc sp. LPT]|nr:hypothetical protein [Nostoc sp. LPT]